MLSVAARGSPPEERKTVSKLHLRLLTPLPGQRLVKIAKFFLCVCCWPHCGANSLSAGSPHPLPTFGQELNSF